MKQNATLHEMRAEFVRVGGRSLAFPIAGTLAWTATGVLGTFLPDKQASVALFVCVSSIVPMSFVIARFLREGAFGVTNDLDRLMGRSLIMVNLVWGIAIPFWFVMKSSLPLSVGILAGLHWIVFGWIIGHWIGMFHAVTRTILVVAAWFLFHEHRFVAVPAVIVVVYLVTIYVLATRPLSEPPDQMGT